jgi:deoxyribodipyrimidine photo-lyase
MDKRNSDINRRCRLLAKGVKGPGPVVYWMSREQRCADNWALLKAREEAILLNRQLLVVFCLVPDYPGAERRHYSFLLQGLQDVSTTLSKHNISFRLLLGTPIKSLPRLLGRLKAAVLVSDFDPLRIKKRWKDELSRRIGIPFWEVDAHNIVPAWVVSDKKEYGAYTLRPKMNRLLPDYLTEIPALRPLSPEKKSLSEVFDYLELLSRVKQGKVSEVSWCLPGESFAKRAMEEALRERLPGYDVRRNAPCLSGQSNLSPYLHFGHLSAQRLALEVSRSSLAVQDQDAFLEELIVRRELADNFCYYEPDYDSGRGFPEWARKTLKDHWFDRRDYCYSLDRWEHAETHDRLWNACQKDLATRGKLHGYLRMYWAKKLLEWTGDPDEAMEYAIELNDRYSLDGRDANGYTGIAWSIGGVHDRAWKERPVYGKIRYMNENGCRRKFDVESYIQSV